MTRVALAHFFNHRERKEHKNKSFSVFFAFFVVKNKWPLVRRSDVGLARSPCLTGPNGLTGPTKDDCGALCLKRWNHEWTRMNTNGKWECGAWSAKFSISVFNHRERKAHKKYLFSVFFAFFVVKNKWPLIRRSDGGLARSPCPTGPNGPTKDDRSALCLKRWNHEWTRVNTNGKWEYGAWSAKFFYIGS